MYKVPLLPPRDAEQPAERIDRLGEQVRPRHAARSLSTVKSQELFAPERIRKPCDRIH